ncbi:hypothetical protein [Sphingomonas sp.]|jgi:hypothetical protein|uniref:Pam3-gp28 family putative phage holin n=1 Tax=Sphingomonadales TaxID=204457 RepID=UPI0035C82B9E
MTDPDTTPIVVNPDQTAAQLGVAIRYALTAIGGYLVAKGWISGDLLEVLVNAAVIVGPAAYASYRSDQQKKVLVTVASAAPDSVSVIKGSNA